MNEEADQIIKELMKAINGLTCCTEDFLGTELYMRILEYQANMGDTLAQGVLEEIEEERKAEEKEDLDFKIVPTARRTEMQSMRYTGLKDSFGEKIYEDSWIEVTTRWLILRTKKWDERVARYKVVWGVWWSDEYDTRVLGWISIPDYHYGGQRIKIHKDHNGYPTSMNDPYTEICRAQLSEPSKDIYIIIKVIDDPWQEK